MFNSAVRLGCGALLVVTCASGSTGCGAPEPRAAATVQAGQGVSVERAFQVRVVGAPAGRPMILIPGLGCAGNVWESTVRHYQDRYSIHVVTLAGFGGVEARPSKAMLDGVRRDLVAYIAEQKLERPVIVGHSMGAFMAYWVAATAPDKVGAVVAVDGLPFLSALFEPGATAESNRASAAMLRDRMGSAPRAEFAAENRRSLVGMIREPKDVDFVASESGKSDPRAVAEAVYELMTTDLRDEVAKMKAPALIFAAAAFAKDESARKEVASRYEAQVAKIPDHRVVVAPDALHFVMLDAPSFFFAETDAFLAREGVR